MRNLGTGHSEALLLVDGIRCAACVWLIERAVGGVGGVQSVQVNASAQRARIVWDPQRTTLAAILHAFAHTGYGALPLDAAALDVSRRRESRAALKRLAVAGFGTMQAMMYASALCLGAVETMDAATRVWMRWFGLLVATPVVFYSARPFFEGAAIRRFQRPARGAAHRRCGARRQRRADAGRAVAARRRVAAGLAALLLRRALSATMLRKRRQHA